MLVLIERVSFMLELLHGSPRTHFEMDKTYQRACEMFHWPFMKMEAMSWTESRDVCLKRKITKQKQRLSLAKWKPIHPF